jgi:hypothetical protein
MRAAAALILVLTGCAVPLRPPRDLLEAEATLARAQASPFADQAADEIREAEAVLTAAERAARARPGMAATDDDAYVALRAAEKAEIAARYAAERIALEKERGAAERLSADIERRDAFFTSLARRRAARDEAEAALRARRREALERAQGPHTQLLERPDGLLFRFSADDLFLPGTSLLRDGAEDRLAHLCHCLTRTLPLLLRLSVLDDVEGFKTAPVVLAARRAQRLRDVLRAHGVPEDCLLPCEKHPPLGTEVDLLVLDPALPLPAD